MDSIHDKVTDKMHAVSLEGGQLNAYGLLNELMLKGVLICLVRYSDTVMFHVKHLACRGDYVECRLNDDMVLFITKRTPLTLYVSGVL